MGTPASAAASAAAEANKPGTPPGASEDSILQELEKPPVAELPKPGDSAASPDKEIPPAEVKPKEGEKAPEELEEKEPDLEERPALPDDAFHKLREDGTFKAHPELRGIIGRHEAYSELGTVAEFRQLRETFPTQEDVEKVTGAADELRVASETFREDPAAFTETLREIDAEAFKKFTLEFPKAVAQLDPSTYSVMRAGVFEDALGLLRDSAEADQNQELLDQLEAVAVVALGRGLSARSRMAARPDPRDAELTRLRKATEDRERTDRQQEFQQFHSAVETAYMDQCLAEIEALVVKALPGVVADDKQDIVREVWDKLQETLTAQPQTKAYAQKMYQDAAEKSRVGATEQKALVDFLVKRAKLAIPGPGTRAVLAKWTRRLVSANQEELEKRRKVAAQGKDAGGPAGAPAKPTAGSPPAAAPAKRKTEDEIFAELEAQVPRA